MLWVSLEVHNAHRLRSPASLSEIGGVARPPSLRLVAPAPTFSMRHPAIDRASPASHTVAGTSEPRCPRYADVGTGFRSRLLRLINVMHGHTVHNNTDSLSVQIEVLTASSHRRIQGCCTIAVNAGRSCVPYSYNPLAIRGCQISSAPNTRLLAMYANRR